MKILLPIFVDQQFSKKKQPPRQLIFLQKILSQFPFISGCCFFSYCAFSFRKFPSLTFLFILDSILIDDDVNVE